MRKTGSEIEADVYAIINASALKTAVNGNVYKEGIRPLGAKTEDIVVSFLTGLDDQIQTGVLNVNIYVPDIDNGEKVLVKNISRCKALEIIANTLIQGLKAGEYRFKLASIIQTFKADGISQHFINCKIKFQLVTF
jgi:hypothetical protein